MMFQKQMQEGSHEPQVRCCCRSRGTTRKTEPGFGHVGVGEGRGGGRPQ